jgi:hypothetical protein
MAEEGFPVSTDELNEPNDRAPNKPNASKGSSNAVRRGKIAIGFDPAALVAKSEERLSVIYNQLKKELKPRGIIESGYVEDLAYTILDIRDLRTYKNRIIRYEMQPALKAILEHIAAETGDRFSIEKNKQKKLAADCYRDSNAQVQVATMLAEFNLDETNIEAEAWRRASTELNLIERQLMSLEIRRDKTLNGLADYRDVLTQRLKQKVQRIIDADNSIDVDARPPASDEPGQFSRLS